MEFAVFQIQEVHYVSSLRWTFLNIDLCSLLSLPSQVFVHTGKIPLSFLFSRLSNPSCLPAPPCITLLQVFNHHHCSVLALLQHFIISCPGEATAAHSILNMVPLALSRSIPLICLGLPLSASLYSISPSQLKRARLRLI